MMEKITAGDKERADRYERELKMPWLHIDEYTIRQWFVTTELEQARDTLRVCEGIIQARLEAQPKRKQRSDAGKTRGTGTTQVTWPDGQNTMLGEK